MFPQMADVLPERSVGCAAIEHFTVSKHEAVMTAFGGSRSFVEPGHYARLIVRGETMMSDTRWERYSNYGVANHAHGDVLIAGLGMGMILHSILRKESVRSVTVLEIEQDVIDLIQPTLPVDGVPLQIIHADANTWTPVKGQKFNCIYYDIWVDSCVDNLAQIAKLHQRAKYWLDRTDPECWMGSWDEDWLRAERRRYGG